MPRHNLAIVDPTPSGSSRINSLAAKYKAISAEEKELAARKKAINDKLMTAMKAEAEADAEGKLRLVTAGYKLVVVPGRSADQISGKLLLKYGVAPRIVKKATVPGTEYEYVRVDVRKDAGSDGDDADNVA